MKLVNFCFIFSCMYIITRCSSTTTDEYTIAELKSYFERELQRAAQQYKSRIKEMEKTIRELKLSQQNNPTELLQLQTEVKSMRIEMQDLKDRVDEKTSEVDALKEQVEMLEQKQTAKESELVPEKNFEKGNVNTNAVFVKSKKENNMLHLETSEIKARKGMMKYILLLFLRDTGLCQYTLQTIM